ncbi:MAG: 16S rRNA (cytidine(1402)-2'-O)-methyltransferase [Myxococcota bacterium]|nr:16S rRNA (cytidine(1402)-2'-O)-methyltransferase [Myxococcota bacterium]
MKPACLYMVATPIGHLADISARALEVLAEVDIIFAEDTRHSRKLLSHYGISTHVKSLHAQNEKNRSTEVIRLLEQDKTIAYICDAGTPGVSDPGAYMVAAVVQAGHVVRPIPGASALAAGLSVCGFAESSSNTLFVGFLAVKGAKRSDTLKQIAAHQGIVVLYEGPHRFAKTLSDLVKNNPPERPLCVCREVSKVHEEIVHTTLGEALTAHADNPKGEFTLVIGPQNTSKKPLENSDLKERLRSLVNSGLSRRDAAKALVVLDGAAKKTLYKLLEDADI